MKITTTVNGTRVEIEKMEFTPVTEAWTCYRLDDGIVVKMRLIVTEIFKMPEVDALTGLPQFIVKSSTVMSVDPPSASRSDVH